MDVLIPRVVLYDGGLYILIYYRALNTEYFQNNYYHYFAAVSHVVVKKYAL
jgi:hypothetical protein